MRSELCYVLHSIYYVVEEIFLTAVLVGVGIVRKTLYSVSACQTLVRSALWRVHWQYYSTYQVLTMRNIRYSTIRPLVPSRYPPVWLAAVPHSILYCMYVCMYACMHVLSAYGTVLSSRRCGFLLLLPLSLPDDPSLLNRAHFKPHPVHSEFPMLMKS